MIKYSTPSPPPVAILAGGLATRLRPITTYIPKVLVEVAGEPFIRHQLRFLAQQGIHDVVLCTGYLGEMVEREVGTECCGCRVRYSCDGDKALGTGGALRKALPLLGENFYVMYGDSFLDIQFAPVFEAFRRAKAPALMTVFHNRGRWDVSNVEYAAGRILRYDKATHNPAMTYIDYGLGVVTGEVILRLPPGIAIDLGELYRDLAVEGRLAGFEVHTRFYDIGSPAGLRETEVYLRGRS